jgi:predicted nucleotidyltransferase
MRRDDALRVLRANWKQLRAQFGVRSLSIYGSVARDQATNSSDIDLLVEFDRPAGYFELGRLQMFLQELLRCQVDINTKSSLRKTIRDQVASEAIRVE